MLPTQQYERKALSVRSVENKSNKLVEFQKSENASAPLKVVPLIRADLSPKSDAIAPHAVAMTRSRLPTKRAGHQCRQRVQCYRGSSLVPSGPKPESEAIASHAAATTRSRPPTKTAGHRCRQRVQCYRGSSLVPRGPKPRSGAIASHTAATTRLRPPTKRAEGEAEEPASLSESTSITLSSLGQCHSSSRWCQGCWC